MQIGKAEGSLDELSQDMLAYQRILRSASVREQSTAKMRKKLRASGFDEDVIQRALDKAVTTGALDDLRYAECLVRSVLSSGKGLSFVRAELEDLGIDIEDLEAYQEHASKGASFEIQSAVAVLEKHPPRAKNKRDAAFRKLISKGFSSEIAFSAISEWSRNADIV